MPEQQQQQQARDPITAFWSDLMAGMTGPRGGAAIPAEADGWARQFQRVFLDAMARYCDEFMRSPQFLEAMKQSMDHALAFRKQLDRFLTEAHRSAQSPALADIDDLCALIESVEERLTARIERLEGRLAGGSAPRTIRNSARARRPQEQSGTARSRARSGKTAKGRRRS